MTADRGASRTLPTNDLTCTATSGEGTLRCVKPKYRARNGEAWEHGGGHFFTDDEGARRLATGNYDAEVVLSSLRPTVVDRTDYSTSGGE